MGPWKKYYLTNGVKCTTVGRFYLWQKKIDNVLVACAIRFLDELLHFVVGDEGFVARPVLVGPVLDVVNIVAAFSSNTSLVTRIVVVPCKCPKIHPQTFDSE